MLRKESFIFHTSPENPLYSIDMSSFLLLNLEQISRDLRTWMIHLKKMFSPKRSPNNDHYFHILKILPVSVDWSNPLESRFCDHRHHPLDIQCGARKGWQMERSLNYPQKFQLGEVHGDWRFSCWCLFPVNELIIGGCIKIDDRRNELSWVRNLVILLPCCPKVFLTVLVRGSSCKILGD